MLQAEDTQEPACLVWDDKPVQNEWETERDNDKVVM